MKNIVVKFLYIILFTASFAFAADSKISLTPEGLRNILKDRESVGLHIMVASKDYISKETDEYTLTPQRVLRKSFQYDLLLDAHLFLKSSANPYPWKLYGRADWGLNIIDVPKIDVSDPDAPIGRTTDRGRISVGIRGQMEGDQSLEYTNALLSIDLRYVRTQTDARWLWIPNMLVGAEYVAMLKNPQSDDPGEVWRWSGALDWALDISEFSYVGWLPQNSFTDNSQVDIVWQGAKEFSAQKEWKESRLHGGGYMNFRYTYRMYEMNSNSVLKHIGEIFLEYGFGRRAPSFSKEKSLLIGVRIIP